MAFSPQIENRVGDYLYAGIMQGATGLIDNIRERAAKREQREEQKRMSEMIEPYLQQISGGKITAKDVPREQLPMMVGIAQTIEREQKEAPLRKLQMENEQLRGDISRYNLQSAQTGDTEARGQRDAARQSIVAQYIQRGNPVQVAAARGGSDPALLEMVERYTKAPAALPGSAGFETLELPGGLGSMVIDRATRQPLDGGKVIKPPTGTGVTKPTEAEVSFDTNISTAKSNLAKLRETIKKHGTWESPWIGNAKASAQLDQLPYQLAIQYAKIVDPNSVAREGEVAAAQKYMITTGMLANKDKVLAQLDDMDKTFDEYAAARTKARGAPGAAQGHSDGAETSTAGGAAAPQGQGSGDTYTDPADGRQYPLVTIPNKGRGVIMGGKFYPVIAQ